MNSAELEQPNPDQIRAWRQRANHTQRSAGETIGATERTWQDWERGQRPMPTGLALLYRLLTDQHPVLQVVPRT